MGSWPLYSCESVHKLVCLSKTLKVQGFTEKPLKNNMKRKWLKKWLRTSVFKMFIQISALKMESRFQSYAYAKMWEKFSNHHRSAYTPIYMLRTSQIQNRFRFFENEWVCMSFRATAAESDMLVYQPYVSFFSNKFMQLFSHDSESQFEWSRRTLLSFSEFYKRRNVMK